MGWREQAAALDDVRAGVKADERADVRADTKADVRAGVKADVRAGAPADAGNAVVDFALVGALVTLVFVAVVQLAVVLHVRNTLVDCASEGARYGALADRDPQAGAQRARDLIATDLSPAYARSVTAGRERFAGLDTVVVRVRAPLPVAGLLGTGRVLEVSGHALAVMP